MKVFLMHRDRDFDPEQKLPWNERALTQDLELNTLFAAMAREDRFLFTVARQAVLAGLDDVETIRYRQDILRDCLRNGAVIREIYQIPIEAMQNKQRNWLGIFSNNPTGILRGAIEMLAMLVEMLRRLRRIADEHAPKFESEGFGRFFAMIAQELDDAYFREVEAHLEALRFRRGVLLSARLGRGNEGTDYVLRRPHGRRQPWVKDVLSRTPSYSFSISPRDEYGGRALGELQDRGVNLVANAVAQSADHIDSFLNMLRLELAFYVGCLNLYERLTELGEPICFPVPLATGERRHSFVELYDACLALTMGKKVVGNDMRGDGREVFIITGANQGGKSTFLRSIGLAQLLMRCGMFVPAESFSADVGSGLFTHFKREEDPSMRSGKLDEELERMSAIVDHIAPGSMILFNESFAATNEREGSEIARQIVRALLSNRVKVFFVTHLYEFARRIHDERTAGAMFLRAERQSGGKRTFRLLEGEPLGTSYGRDLYKRVFEPDDRS